MGARSSKLNCSGRRPKEEPYHPKTDDRIIENGKGTKDQNKPHRNFKISSKENVPKKVHQTTEKSSEASSGIKPKPYEFAKGRKDPSVRSPGDTVSKSTISSLDETAPKSVISSPDETAPKSVISSPDETAPKSVINSPDETAPKSVISSPDETSPKSVISSPDADHNKTKLKEMGHSSIPPLNNDSSLDVDCIPSLNSEQRRLSLDANIEWTAEYGENDENAKQPQNGKTKSVKEETKSIPIQNDESDSTTDSESSDDDDDYVKGGLSFGHVGNLIIGTGKIIDRSTKIVPRKEPKAKTKKKSSTKGILDNKKKSRKGGVNAKRVDNLGIGTVMILDERTIQPEKVQEKHVNIPVSYKPVEEKKQPIPVEDLEKLMGLKSAVGMIYGYQQTGTAFRVGVDKIITAWHVVRAITAVGKLGDHAVFVDFDYEKDFQPDHLLRFPLKPGVLYYNEKLDIAVLQIKENPYGTAFPKPLENFVNFTRQIHEKYSIYLIGHTGAGKKSVDHVLKYWDPLSHRIKELYEWCEEEFVLKHGFGYTGIGDETRLHFQCMFRHGASGCPGFIVPPGGEAKVVTVLLRGFPDFYYFDNFTDEERERVPTEKLIQQGSNIDAIKKDMQTKNMDLYREIFHYREFISHSEKKKCIDTPSEEKVLNFPQNNEPINTEPVDSKDAVTLSPNACSEQNSQNSENMAILASGGNKTHPITNNFDPTQDINSGDEEKSTTNAAQPQTPPAIGHQTEDEKPQDQEKCSTDESKAGTACNNAETTHAILSSETAPNSTVKNQDKNERSEREKKVW
nr:uncharacterized protein LOC105344256 isoform X3 [Crassostrea gigas]